MPRKKIISSVVISLVALTIFGGPILFARQVELQSDDKATGGVEIKVRLVRKLSEMWEFEVSAHNSGSEDVFIVTEPVRSNGSRGGYFSLDPQDPSILDIGILLYPPPGYSIYSNQTRLTLKRLNPGATHLEQLIVSFPARETSPPYKGLEFEALDNAKLRGVRAAIGILPDDEGIRHFLNRKQGIGPYVAGIELVESGPHKGKSLYEVQTIVRTPTVEF